MVRTVSMTVCFMKPFIKGYWREQWCLASIAKAITLKEQKIIINAREVLPFLMGHV
jgi:hypothetical protein